MPKQPVSKPPDFWRTFERDNNLVIDKQRAPDRGNSPWERAYVERLIGSIRRECLDYVILFGDGSLHRTLTAYCAYYHRWRTHLALGKDAPQSRRIQRPAEGAVVEIREVGGLHHHYERRTA